MRNSTIVNRRLIPIDRFDWLSTFRQLSQEASTLGIPVGEVLSDFTIQGATRQVRVVLDATRRDNEGDVMYWQYRPYSIEDQRQLGDIKVRVYND